jgi:rhodanese-related sulfurtransferase
MAARGIIGGYTNGNFGPGDPVIRQQFAKMIVGTLDLPVAEEDFPNPAVPFTDLGSDDLSKLYPHEYVAVCALNEITKGKTLTTFDPYSNITGQQVITMVVRAADNLAPGTLQEVPAGWSGQLPAGDPTHGANIKKAEYNGLLDGIRASLSIPGLAGWDTTKNATRGEVAQMLWNLIACLGETRTYETVDVQTAYERLGASPEARLVDVREPAEWAATGVPPGALLIPLAEVERRAPAELVRDKPVYLICKSGTRSRLAAETLIRLGFTEVYNVDGGIQAWLQAGLPIETYEP